MKLRYKVLLAAGTLAYGTALKYYYDYCFKRPAKVNPRDPNNVFEYVSKQGQKYMSKLTYTKESIFSFDDLKLNGYYFNNHSDTTILLVHGYHSSALREYAQYIPFYDSLGLNILVIDQRSHGESEGKWIDFGYNERYDVVNWIKYLQEKYPCKNLFLMGISMGSSTVLMTSGEDLSSYHVKGIIADCGYDTLRHEIKHVLKLMHFPFAPFYYPLSMIHKIKEGHSCDEISPLEAVKKTNIPILFIHGTEDHFVPVNSVYSLYKACSSYKELYLVRKADHANSHICESDEYEKTVTDFIKKAKEI